jgi:hypothetical protein
MPVYIDNKTGLLDFKLVVRFMSELLSRVSPATCLLTMTSRHKEVKMIVEWQKDD